MKTDGVWYVMTTGEERMPRLSAVSWDSPEGPHWKVLPKTFLFFIGWTMSGAGAWIRVDSNNYNDFREILSAISC